MIVFITCSIPFQSYPIYQSQSPRIPGADIPWMTDHGTHEPSGIHYWSSWGLRNRAPSLHRFCNMFNPISDFTRISWYRWKLQFLRQYAYKLYIYNYKGNTSRKTNIRIWISHCVMCSVVGSISYVCLGSMNQLFPWEVNISSHVNDSYQNNCC